MAQRIQIARAWCDECLAQCWFAFDEQTRVNEHLGMDNSKKWEELKAQGYQPAHRGGVYTFTLWKAQPLALPLDWQMAIEERQHIDVNQDW